ncbi:hypothetical protein HME9302_00275 [Alteripontixanthobacter maritimus]|uniref:DNA-binding protein n=1 Tax=Alteripontixanthobacter maritimus TaxID=2161824 RepID=A0A369Q7F5_9SPHN|nr:DUF177 domain-containing protein [Alteripontixanthobacter maritimus]RDC59096.1 hypothetical protein HME9302_00275 [Alteripontixanthobacter maritimus]
MSAPEHNTPEFSRPIRARFLPSEPVELAATEAERAALAKRFGVVAISSLRARAECASGDEGVEVRGTLEAEILQDCAVASDSFTTAIADNIALLFVPARPVTENPDAEIEVDLGPGEWDEIEYSGDSFDLGEGIAQTLGLAIDPYATGPDADRIRREKGIKDESAPGGQLADALAALSGKT